MIDQIGTAQLPERLGATELPQDVKADISTAVSKLDPYDRAIRAKLGDALLDKHLARFPRGCFERSIFLLTTIYISFPTERLSSAYFDNLEVMLASREPLSSVGQVILGIGTGRCGSTSLSAAFRAVKNGLSTHENPPMIFWQPCHEQMEFHMKRLGLLSRYYSVVFDASHWWINAMDSFFASFPLGKVVGLYRSVDPCVASFLNLKGFMPGTVNHWAPPDNGIWKANFWDPCYPSYPFAQDLRSDYDFFIAKGSQIQRYIETYNQQLQDLASARPHQVILISSETLELKQIADRLGDFIGVEISIPSRRFNSGSNLDSEALRETLWF